MGLLDDAIREHLELKRLRGADPGEVAREQREALDPVPRRGEESVEDEYSAADDPSGSGEAEPLADESARDESSPTVGDETAEIDMRTVLDEAPGRPGGPATSDPEGIVAGSLGASSATETAEEPGEESLEWEMPASSTEHESDSVDGASGGVGASGEGTQAAEDVLEETPDFLRDTPEQERLWFEQRPPRDFDFDK